MKSGSLAQIESSAIRTNTQGKIPILHSDLLDLAPVNLQAFLAIKAGQLIGLRLPQVPSSEEAIALVHDKQRLRNRVNPIAIF